MMPTLFDVIVAAGQAEGTESVVSTWFKSVGDEVTENEPLLEISTDKVNMEVAAPATGRLSEILKRDGEQLEPGDVLGRIEVGSSGSSEKSGASAPEATRNASHTATVAPSGGSSDLSPAVRRLLQEHDLDSSQIRGSGRGGRITHQDVMDFVASRDAPGKDKPATSRDTERPSRPGPLSGRRVPHTHMRRSIAQHMVQSFSVAPHVTSIFAADLTAVIKNRDALKAEFASGGARLTYTAYFVKAAVDAIKAVPEVNSRWHEDALEIFDDANIGIATALGSGGLIVPVIQKAQDLDLFAIASALHDLTERARAEKLDARDVQNGTFTISNHGVSGSLVATPIIINQPQSAILGVGKVERRVEPAGESGDAITVKPMCYVSLTIDHRVLDGFQANQFLSAFVESLGNY